MLFIRASNQGHVTVKHPDSSPDTLACIARCL